MIWTKELMPSSLPLAPARCSSMRASPSELIADMRRWHPSVTGRRASPVRPAAPLPVAALPGEVVLVLDRVEELEEALRVRGVLAQQLLPQPPVLRVRGVVDGREQTDHAAAVAHLLRR